MEVLSTLPLEYGMTLGKSLGGTQGSSGKGKIEKGCFYSGGRNREE